MRFYHWVAFYVLILGAGILAITVLRVSFSGLGINDFLLFIATTGIALALYALGCRERSKTVVLDVRPNEIGVEGEQTFGFAFSAHGRFVTDADLLDKAFDSVAGRLGASGGKFMYLKETPLVRIWPGEPGITKLELDAVAHAVRTHFNEPEFEVMEREGLLIHPSPQSTPEV